MTEITATVAMLISGITCTGASDVVTAWKRNIAAMRTGVAMEMSLRWDAPNGNSGKAKYFIKYSHGNYVYELHNAEGQCSVRLFNKAYSCELRDQGPDGRMAVVAITRHHEGEWPEQGPLEQRIAALLGLMYAVHFSPNASLLSALEKENEVTWTAHDGGFMCDFTAQAGKKLSGRLKSGTLVLGPAPFYRLESARAVMAFYGDNDAENTAHREVVYRYADENAWQVTSIRAKSYTREGGDFLGEDTWDFTSVRLGPIPEAEFTLSAFGLEEPFDLEREQQTPWWLNLAGGTVSILALALLVGVALRGIKTRPVGLEV